MPPRRFKRQRTAAPKNKTPDASAPAKDLAAKLSLWTRSTSRAAQEEAAAAAFDAIDAVGDGGARLAVVACLGEKVGLAGPSCSLRRAAVHALEALARRYVRRGRCYCHYHYYYY